eukprot:1152222-Rhodomonas_salina.2
MIRPSTQSHESLRLRDPSPPGWDESQKEGKTPPQNYLYSAAAAAPAKPTLAKNAWNWVSVPKRYLLCLASVWNGLGMLLVSE